MLCTYVDEIFYCYFMIILYFIFIYFILILLWNLMRHRCCGAEVIHLVGNPTKHTCCGAEVIYFVFSSEMENRTLSQMCGRLYLPIFLFRIGLWTLIYIASFMALALIVPLHAYYFDTVHCCCVASSVLMFKDWWRCFKMFFILFWLTPLYTHHHIQSCHTWTSVWYYFVFFLLHLCLLETSVAFFRQILSFKYAWTPYLLQMVL